MGQHLFYEDIKSKYNRSWREMPRLLKEEKPDLICIQETKKQCVKDKLCAMIWGDKEVEWKIVPAFHLFKGLLYMFGRTEFQIKDVFSNVGFLGIRGIAKEDFPQMVIINIYSPCTTMKKRILWGN